jgi:hypothetical protein
MLPKIRKSAMCFGLFYADEPFFGKTEDGIDANNDDKQAGYHHQQASLGKYLIDKIVLTHDEYCYKEYENQKFLHKTEKEGHRVALYL